MLNSFYVLNIIISCRTSEFFNNNNRILVRVRVFLLTFLLSHGKIITRPKLKTVYFGVAGPKRVRAYRFGRGSFAKRWLVLLWN